MKNSVSQSPSDSVQSQLDAQSLKIGKLMDDAVTKERASAVVAAALRSQVSAQQINIEHLTDIAAAHKETTDASTEHLESEVDSIHQEVEVLSQTVASQAAAIDDIRKDSEPAELRQAYTEYLKAAAEDLGDQYRQEQETHAETRQQLATMAETVNGVRGDSKSHRGAA